MLVSAAGNKKVLESAEGKCQKQERVRNTLPAGKPGERTYPNRERLERPVKRTNSGEGNARKERDSPSGRWGCAKKK